MSDLLDDANPLAELNEVLEILNRSNLALVVPEDKNSIDPAADADNATTSKQASTQA